MKTKTANISIVGYPNGAMQYEVRYRGKLLHTESYDNSNVSGAINNSNAKRAARAAENWALQNGFTAVRWDG